jgi:uncharacterized protein YyaL (SSP411 family)
MTGKKKANRLIHESSPYLLQHAYNPVDWYPWSDEALEKAASEDKPILISIGYSACHWCHVMERESFENDRIAGFLNTHFISIKVDREERPDVDQLYMDAVLAMGVQGGWPLNVFLTPEQKPFFGGTYFPPQSFYDILNNVNTAYQSRREKLNLSAEELANHLSKSDVVKYGLLASIPTSGETQLRESMRLMGRKFDLTSGGFNKAPKFPMPSIWKYILRYGHFFEEDSFIDHVIFTLQKMARGGIYDHLGGGFARYSVDDKWFVPHFEKMLYDNGQLLSLYSEAYLFTGNPEFGGILKETAGFLAREMLSPEGGFYSALDADSEGVEGKFYTWQEGEFRKAVGKEPDFWIDYFGLKKDGNWENGLNILTHHKSIEPISEKFNCTAAQASNILFNLKKDLLEVRSEKVRPALDDKILAGWNGIALSGLIDACQALEDNDLLSLALKNARYLLKHHIHDGSLSRTSSLYNRSIPGCLEDYAFVIQAFIKLYQVLFDESWLKRVKELLDYTIDNFFDSGEGFFFYTDKNARPLIASKKELLDNVIPASNSVMAENLFLSGLIFDDEDYTQKATGMINRMKKLLFAEPEYAANWGSIFLMIHRPFAEIAILGTDYRKIRDRINKKYHPNKLFCGAKSTSELPLLKGRKNQDRNTIYVCYDKSCKVPVHTAQEALKLLV